MIVSSKIKIRILLLCLTLSSCERSQYSNFEITNSTQEKIDSLKISTGTKTIIYISLNPNETKEYKCDLSQMAKVDGDYELSYKINSVKRIKRFGYFTNGSPTGKLVKINIQNDTVLFKTLF
jgi:hypothetical protein